MGVIDYRLCALLRGRRGIRYRHLPGRIEHIAQKMRDLPGLVAQRLGTPGQPAFASVLATDAIRAMGEGRRAFALRPLHFAHDLRQIGRCDQAGIPRLVTLQLIDRIAEESGNVGRNVFHGPALAVTPAEKHHGPLQKQRLQMLRRMTVIQKSLRLTHARIWLPARALCPRPPYDAVWSVDYLSSISLRFITGGVFPCTPLTSGSQHCWRQVAL